MIIGGAAKNKKGSNRKMGDKVDKKYILFGTALIWVVIAIGLIWYKQQLLSTGAKIMLETVPVDPRDMLKGDYVRLKYKISNPDFAALGSTVTFKKGETIYLELKQNGELWEAESVVGKGDLSGTGIVIKGKMKKWSREVEYGIENYYVPEGKGKEIEEALNSGRTNRVTVEAVVGKKGNAMLNRIFINGKEVKL